MGKTNSDIGHTVKSGAIVHSYMDPVICIPFDFNHAIGWKQTIIVIHLHSIVWNDFMIRRDLDFRLGTAAASSKNSGNRYEKGQGCGDACNCGWSWDHGVGTKRSERHEKKELGSTDLREDDGAQVDNAFALFGQGHQPQIGEAVR